LLVEARFGEVSEQRLCRTDDLIGDNSALKLR
jgi:hypothetical protein